MKYTVRPAAADDTERILALLAQIGGLHCRLRPDVFRDGARKYGVEDLKGLMALPDRPIFVAEGGGYVVGYAMCVLRRFKGHPVLADRSVLFIDDLCVDELKRGGGIGTLLFDACVEYARAQGCRSVELNVWANNHGAVEFYRRIGLKTQKIGLELEL